MLMIFAPPTPKPRTNFMNIQDLCRAIVSNTHSREDLEAIYSAAKVVGDSLSSLASMNLRVGDDVYFDAKTRGTIHGKVTKINRKSIKVTSNTGMAWKVSPQFVKKQSAQG